jgi:hypothetical protein
VEGEPGLYFMGLVFQYAVSSDVIPGMSRDAAYSRDTSPPGRPTAGLRRMCRSELQEPGGGLRSPDALPFRRSTGG